MIPERHAVPSTAEECSAGDAAKPVAPDVAAARAVAISVAVTDVERLPLLEAVGRVLAGACMSAINVPPFDNSAMDGYALRTADLAGDAPWTLSLSGRRAAGDVPEAAHGATGSAVRILTGAPVPPQFDAVVMQENCERRGDAVVIAKRPAQGANIRLAGEDVRVGTSLLDSGEVLSPQKLALLAGAGFGEVEVFRRLRVGLISTGSELREAGDTLAPGQIYNSNRILLRGMLGRLAWAQVEDFGIVSDSRTALEAALARAAVCCDAIVTTGGVSAGDEDHVAAILREGGAQLEVVKVAMRPGKPVKIGLVGDTFFAGLPGNPNAALVTFRRIALPALRAMAGLRDIEPAFQPGIAGFSIAKKPGRTEFVPVRITGRDQAGVPVLGLLARGSTASLSAMAAADGIALLPPDDEAIAPGTPLRFEPF